MQADLRPRLKPRAFALVLACALALGACASTKRSDGMRVGAPIALDPLLPAALEGLPPRASDPIAELVVLQAEGRVRLAERGARREPQRIASALTHGVLGRGDAEQLAVLWDRVSGASATGLGAAALVRERAREPEAHAEHREARDDFYAALSAGDLEHVLELGLLPVPGGVRGASLLVVEAHSLRAFALRSAGRHAEAAVAFEAARRAAPAADAYARARLALLEYEVARQAEPELGPELWLEAVETAAASEFIDALFWSRAYRAAQDPNAWPARALERARRAFAPEASPDANPDAVLLGFIAQQRLGLGDAQGALADFARGGEHADDPLLDARLRVGQARCLLALGRHGEATASLIELALGEGSPAPGPALALLGAIELELDRPARAQPLLERAVGAEGSPEWKGRSDALANLGLARVLNGDAEGGARTLKSARARFTLEGELEALGRCLRNELRAAIAERRELEAEEIQQALAALGR